MTEENAEESGKVCHLNRIERDYTEDEKRLMGVTRI